ncbi:hypothetical protein BU14_0161s0029 [Porphyra umbilicalis]|uniref:Uncharacterized protein n=1 Tax=Porphyra umbilicalis TaxID=2786 RepID=A0A1X6P8A1_PORUM|nr:hypothetical protein BU14_0161s0029 [Porphyra umbilicalis]|eukprot:OSX77109.1 hypothetical protein BU14_0161s0029 [Porphyra umbilicalis]
MSFGDPPCLATRGIRQHTPPVSCVFSLSYPPLWFPICRLLQQALGATRPLVMAAVAPPPTTTTPVASTSTPPPRLPVRPLPPLPPLPLSPLHGPRATRGRTPPSSPAAPRRPSAPSPTSAAPPSSRRGHPKRTATPPSTKRSRPAAPLPRCAPWCARGGRASPSPPSTLCGGRPSSWSGWGGVPAHLPAAAGRRRGGGGGGARAADDAAAAAAVVGTHLGEAVARLHRAGIVHGDLTPANVMVIAAAREGAATPTAAQADGPAATAVHDGGGAVAPPRRARWGPRPLPPGGAHRLWAEHRQHARRGQGRRLVCARAGGRQRPPAGDGGGGQWGPLPRLQAGGGASGGVLRRLEEVRLRGRKRVMVG